MHIDGDARLLRVIIGEADCINGRCLYESLIREARKEGLAGATAWHGEMGFGASSRIRTSMVLDLSNDLPVVEFVDIEERISAFLPIVERYLEAAGCGGLITIETIQVHRYFHATNVSHSEPSEKISE